MSPKTGNLTDYLKAIGEYGTPALYAEWREGGRYYNIGVLYPSNRLVLWVDSRSWIDLPPQG